MEECTACQSVFGPREFNGVRELRTFKGYTIDFRLREFRKVPRKSLPEFIDFDSRKGQRLQREMHQAATDLFNRKVANLA